MSRFPRPSRCLLSTLLLAGSLFVSWPLQAQVETHTQQTLQLPEELQPIQQQLQALPKITDIYERADQLDLITQALEKFRKQLVLSPETRLLHALYLLELAQLKSEFGASAINYWEYISQEVDPLKFQAEQEIKQALASSELSPPAKAWGLFIRARLASSWDDPVMAEIQKDFKESCKLGYQPACEALHESTEHL